MVRMIILVAALAAGALASSDVVDLEIAELEAKLLAARERRSVGGEVLSRTRMADTDIFDLANSVSTLATKVSGIQKQQAKLPETLASLSAAVAAIVPSIKRIDALAKSVSEVEPKVAALKADVAKIDARIANKFDPLQKDITAKVAALKKTLATTKSTLETQMQAAEDSLPGIIAARKAASKKVTDALNVKVTAAVAAASGAGADSQYTQWGRNDCTAPSGTTVKTLFKGWWYGVRHNEAGGGGEDICLRDTRGDNGGHHTGGDSADMIYPIRLEHGSYTGVSLFNSRSGHPVPCARCFLKGKNCYLETANEKCTVANYQPLYTGHMFGAHYSHHGNNNRVCVDQNAPTGHWDRGGNWNGHVYPTIRRDGVQSIGGQSTIRCHMCCQK